ncbi:MAG: thiamine pyrophosphate-dependent dehydrogenase E1 component subunit alpha [Desulfobacteraceae bacterium]|nr:MAG: thiamine pyrophosphate-dependent dehydrogenase E1 component subunit alpha [Desulfobacteraceae bacterium]
MSIPKKKMIEIYTTMVKIRMFETKVSELFAANKIPGVVHLYIGEEAVAAGVCAALKKEDYITSTHRGHGHLLAKGGEIKRMLAELFGKKTGYCKGKGGSMHIADIDLGILGANGIVGGGPPLAAGAALAAKYRNQDAVAVSFFGDGASNQGTTHEAMNLAACWKLPVIFVNENNMYGLSACTSATLCIADVADRASAYGMPGVVVDGNDVIAVYEAAAEAVRRGRKGLGPTLLECKTYRHRGHTEGDPGTAYRSRDEVEEWKKKDPIPRLEKSLIETKVLTRKQMEGIRDTIDAEIQEGARFAEESPYPDVSDITADVYA